MKIYYDDRTDLLYLRFDERKQEVVNMRVSDDVVFDMGADNKIVGIEILDASHHLDLSGVLPIQYQRPIYQERERVEAAAPQMAR